MNPDDRERLWQVFVIGCIFLFCLYNRPLWVALVCIACLILYFPFPIKDGKDDDCETE